MPTRAGRIPTNLHKKISLNTTSDTLWKLVAFTCNSMCGMLGAWLDKMKENDIWWYLTMYVYIYIYVCVLYHIWGLCLGKCVGVFSIMFGSMFGQLNGYVLQTCFCCPAAAGIWLSVWSPWKCQTSWSANFELCRPSWRKRLPTCRTFATRTRQRWSTTLLFWRRPGLSMGWGFQSKCL